MADYISREAVKEKKVYLLERREFVVPVAEIDWLPAADVVEVVRCKDCINWNGNDCITMHGLSAPRPDDYCSRGEKNSG